MNFTLLCLTAALLFVPSELLGAADIAYDGPLVIGKGGSYSGRWQSTDPAVAAVTITTNQPVIIHDCYLRGPGNLIRTQAEGADVTVRSCVGRGVTASVPDARPGRFFSAYRPYRVVAEGNDMESIGGIYVDGAGNASLGGIIVRYNDARNIEGRTNDGLGGRTATGMIPMQFIQLNGVRQTPNIEIAWNQVVNEPFHSRVEDNINIYLSSGTPNSPIRIHDNYIQGAFSADPVNLKFSGGGIITDGAPKQPSEAPAYISIVDNQVVATSNYGIAIAAGHDIDVERNRIISAAQLADGRTILSGNVGMYVANYGGTVGATTLINNTVTNNIVGWMNANGKLNPAWFPACEKGKCDGNDYLTEATTKADEAAEVSRWHDKLQAHHVRLGVPPPQTQTPTVSPRTRDTN